MKPSSLKALRRRIDRLDETLLGRDCQTREGMMQRRVDELERLRRPEFFQAVARAGFQLVNPAQLLESGVCDAA